jgi:hypothetical protein
MLKRFVLASLLALSLIALIDQVVTPAFFIAPVAADESGWDTKSRPDSLIGYPTVVAVRRLLPPLWGVASSESALPHETATAPLTHQAATRVVPVGYCYHWH